MSKHHIIEALRAPSADRGKAVTTAAWCACLSAVHKGEEAQRVLKADDTARRLLLPAVVRADQSVGTTTGSGWADDLVQTAVGGFVSSIAPLSAGARLIAAGERVPLGATDSVSFPVVDTSLGAAPWVEEGEPIGVTNFDFDAATLGPSKKVATILPVSRELVKRSAGRVIFDRLLRETAAHALDLAIFSADAASAAACAGLRAGLTPVAGNGDPESDIVAMLTALATLGSGGVDALICNPREAAVLAVRLPLLKTPVFASRAMPAGTVLAIDVSDFASSVSDIEIFASEEAVIHMSDTPLPIVSGAPVTADPVRSAWQTNCIALRMILEMSFVARAGRVAVMESVSWT
ncbi:phage major capsid family protein [Methylocystis sp.]|uniref:phage major capsid family protein n=1 Tax=Methylocystis sp. TaxID=1911079 RepID=UPI003DA44ABE